RGDRPAAPGARRSRARRDHGFGRRCAASRPCDRHRHTAAPCRRGALSGEACGARPGAARCRGKERRCAGARPTGAAMKKKKYETAMEALQVELNNVARWLRATGKRLVIV